ncbi:MAG: leucine-rich repeat domain-containing protein, partial [Chitinophagales bacterium]|nr:leucine-rich repeat domain-containing protein [Chitinophagales bacterium]
MQVHRLMLKAIYIPTCAGWLRAFIFQRAIIWLCACTIFSSCGTYRTYTSLDKALQNPAAVQRLKISNKNLGSLPAEIVQLHNLKELIIFRSHIDSLPAEIGNLKELEYLSVTSSRLQKVPPEIGQLQKLRRLSFAYNQLESLPEEIGNLTNLY